LQHPMFKNALCDAVKNVAEEKAMELENINSKQQKEHNMFLNSFSTEIEYQRELEIEIEKLQTELSHLQEENKKAFK
jgi:glycine cleavage system regulatory protein